ncbi:putative membrane-anchored protein [Rhizobium lusitanum]|uniref:Putative membrane-anchored protein n=1 Tax=Rhizobium lusitanum TaxID=293958 RepID=A0A7X0IM12_9HYPH|nr:putative membrane-anchored protein [Rhizobium lusitanum]
MAGMIAAGAGVKVAAKLGLLAVVLGFFKSFGVALLALKKGLIVILIGLAAVGRKILGLFRRKDKTDIENNP